MLRYDPITTCTSVAPPDKQPCTFDRETERDLPAPYRLSCKRQSEHGAALSSLQWSQRCHWHSTMVTTLPLAQYNGFGVPSVLVSNNQHWTLTIKYLSPSAKRRGQHDMRPFDSPVTGKERKTNIAVINSQS